MPTLADIQAKINSAQEKLDRLRKVRALITETDKEIAALGNLNAKKTALETERDNLIDDIRVDFNAGPSP